MNIHSSVTDPSGYTHRWVLDFELAFFNKDFYSSVENWMTEWWWISIPYAVAYIILVFLGRAIMEKREKFQLRFPLFLWNLSLTVFSCWGAIRTVPEVFYIVKHHGFRSSLCDPIFKEGITGFWSWTFMLSKLPETLDTLFIVLRGQPLSFLHWYHHASVLVYCFYSYALFVANGRWFSSMNYCVHTIMYGYYALRAARIRVPQICQKSITFLQLIQMVIGCYINVAALIEKQNNDSCSTSISNIRWSLLLYASYFILFGHFFYNAYIVKSRRRDGKKEN